MIDPTTTETVRSWTIPCAETYPVFVVQRSSSVLVDISRVGPADADEPQFVRVHESQLRGLADLLAQLADEVEKRDAARAEEAD